MAKKSKNAHQQSIERFLIMVVVLAALPFSMYAMALAQDIRSRASFYDNPGNPCYPIGCQILDDGSQRRPSGDILRPDGSIYKCEGVLIAQDCLDNPQAIIPPEPKANWWNPITWLKWFFTGKAL